MKQYKYVKVYIANFIGSRCEEHRDIIDKYATEGYRYVGFIPTNISDSGKFKEIDLIFEFDC